MPTPNPTNRERLLRLIDGGTEALKEMQPEVKKAAAPWATGKVALERWKSKLPVLSGTELMRFGKWLIALAALIAALHYGLEMMRAMNSSVKSSAVSPEAATSTKDETEVGLRLVGVDTSDEAPVALLEDTKTGKTYFARVNEKVKGVRVKQVQKNKVTVSYNGKNMELR